LAATLEKLSVNLLAGFLFGCHCTTGTSLVERQQYPPNGHKSQERASILPPTGCVNKQCWQLGYPDNLGYSYYPLPLRDISPAPGFRSTRQVASILTSVHYPNKQPGSGDHS